MKTEGWGKIPSNLLDNLLKNIGFAEKDKNEREFVVNYFSEVGFINMNALL